MDILSKYCHMGVLDTRYNTTKVAQLFVDIVVKLHGFPKNIVSNRDSILLSHLQKELFRFSSTKIQYSAAYHSQTDGQTKVMNRVIQQYLRCYLMNRPTNQVSFLPQTKFSYNTSVHERSHLTPFELIYRRKPPTLPIYEKGTCRLEIVDSDVATREEVPAQLKENFQKAQARMKHYADQHKT